MPSRSSHPDGLAHEPKGVDGLSWSDGEKRGPLTLACKCGFGQEGLEAADAAEKRTLWDADA